MGKVIQKIIDTFHDGVADSLRQNADSVFGITKHFDIFSSPDKLIPYKDTENAYVNQDDDRFQSFLVTKWNDGTNRLFALGVVPGTARASIKFFSDFSNPTISVPSSATDDSGTTNFQLFVEYKGKLYGASAGSRIWSYQISNTTFTSSARSISYTNIAQGLVHSKSDVLYIPYDNKIASLDGTTWDDTAFVIPQNFVITSIAEYGEFLAVGARQIGTGANNSRVFIWDLASEDASEIIDFNGGDLYVLENIDNTLVGVSIYTAPTSSFKSYLIFSNYAGGSAREFKRIPLYLGVTGTINKQKANNRLYFNLSEATSIGGTSNDLTGIWTVGKNKEGRFAVTIDRVATNTENQNVLIKGFILVQDFMYISYMDQTLGTNYSKYFLTKTNDQSSYTAPSVYESKIFNFGNPSAQYALIAVATFSESLPSFASIKMKYKKDNESSWSLISTQSEAGTFSKEAVNIESDGSALPQYHEIRYRLESLGGAEITGFLHKSEILDTLINNT